MILFIDLILNLVVDMLKFVVVGCVVDGFVFGLLFCFVLLLCCVWFVFIVLCVVIGIGVLFVVFVVFEVSVFYLFVYVMMFVGKLMCYVIVVFVFDFVWGYCGILSFGYGLFFVFGGYVIGMYLMCEIGCDGKYGSDFFDFMVFFDWY